MHDSWVSVFKTGTDYEADIVRDRLDDSGISAVVLNKSDRSIKVQIGDLAKIDVMVPPEQEAAARAVLAAQPVTDEELNNAAEAAQGDPEEAGPENLFDSGSESIHLQVPGADEDRE